MYLLDILFAERRVVFCELPEGYEPTIDEPFMNKLQKEYFRRRLIAWRDSLQQHSLDTCSHLKGDNLHEPDDVDNASLEEELTSELLARDREAKLLVKIDEAIQRLESGTYGFCEATGDPIGLERLKARPVAVYCLEAQEQYEKEKHLYGLN